MRITRPQLAPAPGGNVGAIPITSVQRVLTDPMALVDATILFTKRRDGTQAVEPSLEPERLFAAARGVCERHEALRTVIDPAKSVQVVHSYTPDLVATTHLTAQPGTLFEVLDKAAQQPMDPRQLPVFRCVAVTEGDRTAVHFGAPHTVSDRASMQVVVREFLALLRSSITGEPAALAPPGVQYADYVRWRDALCASESSWSPQGPGTRALQYWSAKLSGATTPPFVRPRSGPDQLDRMTFRHDSIGPELTAALVEVCRSARSSLFQGVLAAFEEAVARQTGVEDLTTLCMVHGRGRAELRDTVGLLTEEVVFRHTMESGPHAATRRDHLTALTRDVLLTYAHQDIPLAALARRSAEVARYYSLHRFRTMYLHFRPFVIGAGLQLDIPGVEVSFPRTGGSWPAFRLSGGALFSVDQVADRLEVELMYDPRVWPDQAMAQLVEGFAEACRAFAHRPDEALNIARDGG